MKIGYFNSNEFADKGGAKSPFFLNVQPEVIVLANAIRSAFGAPLIVSSGYRSPERNAATPDAASDSKHVLGLACDLCPEKENMKNLNRLHELALLLNPAGGVGLYDWGVHIDCRMEKARWDFRTEKK